MPSDVGVTFDGPNRLIVLDDGALSAPSVDASWIYSRWKDWVTLTDNSKWPEAFLPVVGGEDLGGGQSIDGYFFLNNSDGWRLRPGESDHTLFINGNLYPGDANTPLMVETVGGFSVNVRQIVSSKSIVAEGSGGGTIDYDRIRDDIIPHIWAARPSD